MKNHRFAEIAFRLLILPAAALLASGCSTFSEQARMDRFKLGFDVYEAGMRTSNFSVACGFVNPDAMSRENCLKRFNDVKVVEYKTTHFNVLEDTMRIEQEVTVQYYPQHTIVLKKNKYTQFWVYQEDTRRWLIEDGPPAF